MIALSLAVVLPAALDAAPTPASGPTRATAASNPFQSHALASKDQHWIAGTVLERVTAGPYVYVRLREDTGDSAWLVSMKALTPSAAEVRALIVGRAEHFHSRRLDRDFRPLLFAAVRSNDTAKPKTPSDSRPSL